MRAYLIEPQELFVPALLETVERAGVTVVQVSPAVDVSDLVRIQPKLLFVDIDYLAYDPIATIGTMRTVLPESLICVYTGNANAEWPAACRYAGADGVLFKSASEAEMQWALGELLERGTYTGPETAGERL